MRVMILYEHCSPHQVTAVEHARRMFQEQGDELIPVEFYYGSLDYTWTLKDQQRSDSWLCLYPDKKKVSNYRLFQDLRHKIKELRIDVVVINGWYGLFSWWLVFLKKWVGCKVVVVSDTVQWYFRRVWMKENAKKLLLRGVDAGFVAGTPQSEYLQLLGMPANRLTLGSDVVNNEMYTSVAVRERPVGRKMIIGTVARLIPEKNLAAALVAFQRVVKRHPEFMVEWRIAGQGPLEGELKQIAHELQVPVVFQGFVGYHEISSFYAQLDLYWQPSHSDSWGLVINEAMAAALPVLVSERCGCARDLVTPLNGWIHGIGQEEMPQALEVALSESDHWPERGLASRELIKAWDLPRFAKGLYDACQIAVNTPR